MGLQLTGERTLPGIWHENYWFRRHEAAYRFAADRCTEQLVIDAGCGEGYGCAILAGTARWVLGVELVAEVCDHAGRHYPQATFVQADLCRLPLPEAAVDAVVSLQVIEHLPDIERFLHETRRVLRPGGRLVCATPNRLTFTPDRDRPVNPFHTVEFAPDELAALLGRHFVLEGFWGVFHGPRLRAVVAEHGTPITELVLSDPQGWPPWLAQLVSDVRTDDFVLAADDLRPSLDLVALARRA